MPLIHAIVLGIVQGLSEFLPISSSGHLAVVPWLFHWNELEANPALNKTFDVALHMGTFVGAAAYFWADLTRLIGAAWTSLRHRRVENDEQRLAWLLLIASLPAATIGVILDSVLQGHYGPVWLIGVMLIVFGLLLWYADHLFGEREVPSFRLRDALLMGFGQALALQPGVSRSGVTITVGRWLRFDRDASARISFLMSLPIIGGAGVYKGLKLASDGIPAGFGGAFAAGVITSAVVGFLAVWATLRYVRTRSFDVFVIYRVIAGLFIIAVAIVR
ncbi:MAG TPA: undecaprenyl-diphosphate phosphatase [Acidimicrobiales bacterium]|nr:undecaprenyl-diphosphate phosphatase [Acidimicrobiales bacterium]